MLAMHDRFQCNSEEVAAKVIDGEAIIINLSNGMYFSMDKVGATIWEMVDHGISVEEMVANLTARYHVSSEDAEADVKRVLGALLEEELIRISVEGPAADTPISATSTPLDYEPPYLNKYSDMADLLALDPPMPGLAPTPWDDDTRPGNEQPAAD